MEKNFLNITPESGNGNQEVTINAKANISLDERSESLRIRTSNGVEKQVRITQDPGMIFFPTMTVSGIQAGQGQKKFAPLEHYPVISPQSDKNWLVDSINIGNLLLSFTNGRGVIVFQLRILMKKVSGRIILLRLTREVLPITLRIRVKSYILLMNFGTLKMTGYMWDGIGIWTLLKVLIFLLLL